ncbi:succinate semialdehyde dehydrogenase NADP+ linked [Saitozyma podzolica]|uniref:Succinate-semialdehyde dehydrogenase, mitochondrial n=1 Tax=Saitozyma podzolica TaxID=1890683 RepID=A0A427XVZ7_9TREE|nr:succinate semialdehyde dehydrogenase NADP+ linked [Saitozyma podzolica]
MVTTTRTQDLASQLADSSLFRTKGFVNGQWVDASDGLSFTVTNPATGEKLGEMPNMPRSQIQEAIVASKTAFPLWAKLTAHQRQGYLLKLFQAMEENANDLALILTAENGKPFAEAKGEIAYGAGFVSWFAAEAVRTYGHTVPSPFPNTRNTVIKQPVGVCGLITPWNFPNAMITRKMAPALAAGCTMVIKAPAETPLSALAMCALAERVGIPPGVVNCVTVEKGEREAACGLELCENVNVSKISFTGSTPVGRLLMKQSSGTLKKLSFELGGNAAFIVFDDADLNLAIEGVIASKFRAGGQTCVCANRIFVHAKVYDEFASRLAKKVKAFKPTVLVDVPKECAIASEETFGPLAALFKFEDEDDVVVRANDSEVGLAGYFYTKDVSRTYRVAEKLQVGMVAVNTGVIAQTCVPFGGVKQSGFGREGGKSGIDEYMIEKLITIGGI